MLPLKNDFCYAILDDRGTAEPGAVRQAGFYLHDTRHLSTYGWTIDDLELIHQSASGSTLTQFWSRMARHAQRLLVKRVLTLRPDGLTDTLTIESSSREPQQLRLALSHDADFADIFEARGSVRLAPANPVTTEPGAGGPVYRYLAQDGVVAVTRFDLGGAALGPPIAIAAGATLAIAVDIAFETTLPAAARIAGAQPWRPAPTGQRNLHPDTARVLAQAIADIDTLMLQTPYGRTIAAGIPNFVAPFGRDSIITAWLLLDTDADLARSVLAYLAARQGKAVDRFHDEEPGKILHEHREGELSRIGELPFRTYFGSADATPLFLVLLGDYVARTGDTGFAKEMEPHWRAALAWIEQYSDARGLIAFRQRSDGKGLVVQSWKDSSDSMSYGDGRLGEGNLAVAEVQGYVYAALRAATELSRLCGGAADEQRRFAVGAETLALTFDRLFWMPRHGNYALALDADGRQLDVNASDSGHLLWSGIVPKAKANQLIARLFADDLWSGYGIRTLSTREIRYNALSYHNGSVWPHDTAIFAAGLRRYGDHAGFARAREGLVALANRSSDLRLPELVGGYPRDGDIPPLPYVESCRPQAWAAAALIYVLNVEGTN